MEPPESLYNLSMNRSSVHGTIEGCWNFQTDMSVAKMLPPLKEGFIILTALLHQILYVYNPPNVAETHGCFNKSKEDCKWLRFNQSYLYNDELISVSVFDTRQVHHLGRYKLRFRFSDDSCAESSWLHASEFHMESFDIIPYMILFAIVLSCLVYYLVKCIRNIDM